MAQYSTIQNIRELNPKTFKSDQYGANGKMEYLMRFKRSEQPVNLPENLCIKGGTIYELGPKVCSIELV